MCTDCNYNPHPDITSSVTVTVTKKAGGGVVGSVLVASNVTVTKKAGGVVVGSVLVATNVTVTKKASA